MPDDEVKTERIEIRTTAKTKFLLQSAAQCSHKNVTEFLLDAGVAAAKQALNGQHVFGLNDARWDDFQKILDRPVVHKPRLFKLLSEKSIVE